jgi:hypothetical protein
MAIKLKGALADRIKNLLGGKNLTERRVDALLTELEERRATGGDPVPSEGADALTLMRQAEQDDADREATVGQVGEVHDQDPEGGTSPPIAIPEAESPAHTPAPLSEIALLRQQNELLLKGMKNMEQKFEELRKAPDPKEVDRAIGDGKLPVSSVPAPPLGTTGPAGFPRGVWIQSPMSPRLRFKLCGCKDCTPYRYQHYFCVTCGNGPFHYRQQYPHGRKMWSAPGGTWGINHEVCSPLCWMQLLAALGVTAGVNDAEAPIVPFAQAMAGTASPSGATDNQPEPVQPRMATGSD